MREIVGTILIAGIIAYPVAYLLMHQWLQQYAYRISLTPLPFVASVLILALLAGLLVVIQTIKTAWANPVESLRTE